MLQHEPQQSPLGVTAAPKHSPNNSSYGAEGKGSFLAASLCRNQNPSRQIERFKIGKGRRHLDILTFGVRAFSLPVQTLAVNWVVGWWGVPVACGFLKTAAKATEYGSGSDEAEGSYPAQVECLSKLPFLCNIDLGVVEVTDDGVGNPADWNELDCTREDEKEPSRQNNVALGLPAAWHAPCALHPDNSNHETEEGEHRPSTHQPSGGLQVCWEC